MEIEKYINTLKKESDKLIDNFKEKLTHIPLGKASPELLKNIKRLLIIIIVLINLLMLKL